MDFNDLFAFDDEQMNMHASNMDTSFENDSMDVDGTDRTKVLMIPPVMPRPNTSVDSRNREAAPKQKRMVKMVPVKRKPAYRGSSLKAGGRVRTSSKGMPEMEYDDLDEGDLTEEQRIERRYAYVCDFCKCVEWRVHLILMKIVLCYPLFLTSYFSFSSFDRDRNREHAKQSRIRKRVLLDTLQVTLVSFLLFNSFTN